MADAKKNEAAYTPRLKRDYDERIVKAMTDKFGYKNRLEVPKLDKIVISEIKDIPFTSYSKSSPNDAPYLMMHLN